MDSTVATLRKIVPSLVFLRSEIPAPHPSAPILGEERLGAGVAVGGNRILTAHYLILGASKVEVHALDGRRREVRRLAVDHESGLGVLDLEGPRLESAPLGTARVGPGHPVFLITCTGPSERKGATGHVTQVGPFETFWEYMLERAIMTTAVNPGLAGAPLLDPLGRLLGIVALGLAVPGRYSLAIPVELFLQRQQLLAGEREPEGARRAWIGFYPRAHDGGVVLTGVVSGGPAAEAGLAAGDSILSVEGTPVANLRELYREVWRRAAGERIGFQILRDSAIRVVNVIAGDRDAFFR